MIVYGLTEETAFRLKQYSQEAMDKVAQADIPLMIVAGDEDRSVPFPENAALLEDRYRRRDGRLEIIVKPGVGHHPHSLSDPAPIVRFMRTYVGFD